ncbi:MAG: YegS/Rv2252/BmrU family lipid kinase [Thermomicrobiales bacterium]|nr:YegS/Rv2252/BmrU family lipid kinase [Thermomicrobiales bacterium]
MTGYAAVISLNSRLGAGAIAESLARKLGNAVDLTLTFVGSSDEATVAAREAASRAQIVIAVGGDGTVADVATGIAGSQATLGIVPAGSTNITARSLGVPANPRAAIQLLASGHVAQPIDLGVSGDRCFLHMAGAGFDAEIFRAANADLKKLLGWVAYLPAAAAALRLAPSAVTVRTDDAVLQARSPLVLVANGASAVAPAFRLHPSIAVDDGWLDVLMFTATTPAQVAATIGHLGSMRLDRSPYVVWQRTRRVTIEADPPLSVELDGDIRGDTPRDFAIRPNGLRVLIPAAQAT